MNKILAIILLWYIYSPLMFAQSGVHIHGGSFLKRVEYNMSLYENKFNLDSKIGIDKEFFGDRNAMVEFLFEIPNDEAVGFRIVRDSLIENYILEFKYFRPIPKNYSISKRFAGLLYQNMVSFITNFKAKRDFPELSKEAIEEMSQNPHIQIETIIFVSGESERVTFRTVIEDELWTLWVEKPQGNALKMLNFCRQMIADAKSDKFDEKNYLSLLKELSFDSQ